MNRGWFLKVSTTGAMVAIAAVLSSCESNKPPQYISRESLQPATLKFSARGCENSASPSPTRQVPQREGSAPISSEQEGIPKKWINPNTLLIESHVFVNCAFVIKHGNYKIDGKTLVLEYGVLNPRKDGLVAMCICPHDVSYEITNLKKEDYEIKFLETKLPSVN